MKKKVRLDEILLRMEAVTEDEIKQALLRQKSRGGKLGSQMLYYRFLTEDQLVNALAEQFSVNGVMLSKEAILEDVLQRVPLDILEEHILIPFKFNLKTGELSVAFADPENTIAVSAIKRACGASKVIVHVAPELIILNLITRHYRGRNMDISKSQIVDLPELFSNESEGTSGLLKTKQGPSVKDNPNVLMFTKQLFLKNALPSVFEREGFKLSVVSTTDKLAELLKTTLFSRILVADDLRDEFKRFVLENKNSISLPEVSVFRTVTSALMESRVSYSVMFGSLLMAVRYIAEQRTSGWSWSPPYALISNDILEVSRLIGLSQISADGLRIASLLLIPIIDTLEEVSGLTVPPAAGMFRDLNTSVQIADSLNFPCNISACLSSLDSGNRAADSDSMSTESNEETVMGAGILALVWYRHFVLKNIPGVSSADLEILKSKIRRQAGHLAPSSVVEVYIRTLEKSSQRAVTGMDIFIVGDVRSLSSRLVEELRHHGFRTVEAKNLQEVQPLYSRCRPNAIMVYIDESQHIADEFCQYVRKDMNDSVTALFAVTQQSEPSFLLNMMETGFSDVFTLPLKNEVIIARISRALSSREQGAGQPVKQGFGATFNDITFVDLIQALGSGRKSVRMLLEQDSGNRAEILLREGRIVYANCGEFSGVDVVYKVILWRDNGSFRIEQTTQFPPDNISVSNEHILLEGCRLMDESDEVNN